ncbi:MAG TPA: phytanoyl-CoA dioxygenase family protein [Steroidobacteraceae bacterium]|nr:phytanoyl-CoA dioxygenase family protein [Steroidobacteraceae bacterium]
MKNGFAIIPGVIGGAEVDALAHELSTASLKRSRAGIRHLLSLPAVATLARDPRLIELAASALGCKPVPFGATLFDKSVEANWLVVWHQDTALPLVKRREISGWGPWSEKGGVIYAHAPAAALEQVVALRVHLDDSTADNGPLRVLPGTHELGVLSDEQIHAVSQRLEPVPCTVARGGVLAMRPLLVHASSKVATAAARRVIHMEYAASRVFAHGLQLHAAA